MLKSFRIVSILTILLLGFEALAAIDFGDQKSSTLTTKAWMSLEKEEWDELNAYTDKCINLYSKMAFKQQAEWKRMPSEAEGRSLWALNDVGTCYFIKSKALKIRGKHDLAKKICQLIIDDFSGSLCLDLNTKENWSVADASQDLMDNLGTNIDYGDYTSETILRKAWEALGIGEIGNAIVYAQKCIDLYEDEAEKQQSSLTNYATKDKAFEYWALNDVGSAYYILGEAYSKRQKWKKALTVFKTVIDRFLYAQCWDPKGWFWKPALKCRGLINKIQAEQGIGF